MVSEPTKSLRPIRPRISLPDDPAAGSNSEEGKLKRASVACTECKRRRVRCSNDTPCNECAAHSLECIYIEAADKRRKIAVKQAEEELQYYRGFLEQFLQIMRHGERANVDEVVNIIRAGASENQIIKGISRCLDQDKKDETLNPVSVPNDLALADMGLDIMNENMERGTGESDFMATDFGLIDRACYSGLNFPNTSK